MFQTVEAAPRDAILGLTEAFLADSNPHKINLGVGVYKDATGVTPVLPSVKEAESRILRDETSKGYLGIDGSPPYRRQVAELLWGAGHEAIEAGRVALSQTPGGTGALRVAADFLHDAFPKAQVWLSEPTWPNHPKIFTAAGVPLQKYPYFDAATNGLALEAMLAALEQVPAGDVVVLHGCCHNPTGVDPAPEAWQQIANVVARRDLVPLIDFAYQGFAVGLREDALPLDVLTSAVPELIVCSSFSKNFGLYSERVGSLAIVAADRAAAEAVQSRVKARIRSNYSNPPAHGAAIVTTVLEDNALRSQWEGELAGMRSRIHGMRRLLVDKLAALGVPGDYSFITRQNGMFSFSGLTPDQVERLGADHSIYIVGSGRINVAGVTEANADRLCEAIATVVGAT